MKRLLAAALVGGLLAWCGGEPAEPEFREDFESPRHAFRHELAVVEPGAGPDGSAALRVAYEGYERGSRRVVRRVPLGVRGTEFTLSYDVRFAEDFQFVRGGKLHGLGPDRPVTGGNPRRPDGWSARVNFGPEGAIRTYIYEQDGESQWGVGRGGGDFRFEPGRWHAVSMHLRLNDPPEEANGSVRIFVDGALVVDHDGLRIRGTDAPAALCSALLFSTFHGGSSPVWAPVDEEGAYTVVHAWFDNFEVRPGAAVRAATGLVPESETDAGAETD